MDKDIVLEPDIYEPNFEENIYQDYIPFNFENGIKCPCCTRAGHFYRNRQVFKKHITTNKHKKWLSHLNNNRVNYYSQSLKYAETIKNQKKYIAQLEVKISHLELSVAEKQKQVPVMNLLDLDI